MKLSRKCPVDTKMVSVALKEDAPTGDITTKSTIPASSVCVAKLVAKQNFTLAGIDLFEAVFKRLDKNVKVRKLYKDGATIKKGSVVASIKGKTRAVLTGERVALNYLQHLSGISTLTAQFVEKTTGSESIILDTRKTTPGLRDLEKYAVIAGGGQNHRRDLSEMALIKENHVAGAGGVGEAILKARTGFKGENGFVEIEVRNFRELKEALKYTPDRIMLDNMTPAQVKKAVGIVAGQTETEASGNMTIEKIRGYAKTGVDFISVGSLTHSPPAVDISLLIESVKLRRDSGS